MAIEKLGVCVFENVRAPEDAFASVEGEKPFRVYGSHELPSNVLWVTNLPFKQYQAGRFYHSPNMKQNQYFRTSTDILLKEMGLKHASPLICAQTLSDVLSRTRRLGDQLFNISLLSKVKDYRYAGDLKLHIFPEFLRHYESGELLPLVNQAAMQATQSNQAMSGITAPAGSTTYGYHFPRTAFIRYMMSLPLPVQNDWREVLFKSGEVRIGLEQGKCISGSDDIIGKLKAQNRAMLLRVTVNHMDSDYTPFQAFSAGTSIMRTWAPLPEVIELSRYSSLTISGGVSSSQGHLSTLDPIFKGVEQEFSLSRGLLLENAWTAIALGYNNMKHTMLGAYLRAYDRVLCSKAAAAFHQTGYTVGSFGTGRVTLYLRPGEVEAANKLAGKLGMMTSLVDTRESV